MLQKERDKREAHAQGTKDLRIKYITGIYEAELSQVEDEFQVRRPARFSLVRWVCTPRPNSPVRADTGTAQAEQRRYKEELLAGIRLKMNQLLNSGGASRQRTARGNESLT